MEQEPAQKRNILLEIYDKQYKKLLIIPLLLLFLSIFLIISKVVSTGDFINRDISLKGGLTITIPTEKDISLVELQNQLESEFRGYDISVRALKKAGAQFGLIVDADIERESINDLIASIGKGIGIELSEGDYSVEVMGDSLGASFFKETMVALLMAFLLMGIVVFICFKIPVPSMAVILATFSDIVITLAVVNLIGLKISTGGIAAFLTLIGYGVDTNILLTSKVLNSKESSVFERLISALKTGMTMTFTILAAVIVALIFTESDVIREIMIILAIGQVADIINTWIQNAAILRIYMEKKEKNGQS